MTAFLVFLALGLLAWAVAEWLDDADRRDARARNPLPRHTRNHGRGIR